MPAVTVADRLVLPRISVLDPQTTVLREVRQRTTAPSGLEGEGFPVRRAFAGIADAALAPFIHMDQMGEVEYGPGEPKGTPWHPHRGFETVTYMIDGVFVHRDSIGGGGLIRDGATQWMTAGRGILHIETPPESLVVTGGLFHGIQTAIYAQQMAARGQLEQMRRQLPPGSMGEGAAGQGHAGQPGAPEDESQHGRGGMYL